MTGDEDVGVAQYRSGHPTFPQETTADQFSSEDQFESYRRLGQHVARHVLRGTTPGTHPLAAAEKLSGVWAPTSFSGGSFVKNTERLDSIWERFRQSPTLYPFLNELMGIAAVAGVPPPPSAEEEMSIGLELIQDTFLDLRLDDFWEHPDNRGWAMLFTLWARSLRFVPYGFRPGTHSEYGLSTSASSAWVCRWSGQRHASVDRNRAWPCCYGLRRAIVRSDISLRPRARAPRFVSSPLISVRESRA